MRYFFVRQKYEEGRLDVQYVKTTDQLADLFTKQLPQAQHEKLTLSLMGYNLPIVNKEWFKNYIAVTAMSKYMVKENLSASSHEDIKEIRNLRFRSNTSSPL